MAYNNYGGYGGYGGGYGGYGYNTGANPYMTRGNNKSLINFSPANVNYIGRPVQAIGQAMDYFGQMNRAVVDQGSAVDLAISSLEIEPEDEVFRQVARDKLKSGIEEISNSEDYHTIYTRAKKLALEFQGDKGLRTVVANSAKYNTFRENLRGRYEEGEVSPERYSHYMNKGYTATNEDEHGFYSKWIAPEVMNDFDHNKALQDFVSKWKANTTVEGVKPIMLNNQFVGWKETVWETSNEKDLAEAMKYLMMSDPHASAFADELSEIRTENGTPISSSNVIDNWIAPYAQQASYTKDLSRHQMYNIPVEELPEPDDSGYIGITESGHGYIDYEVLPGYSIGENHKGLREDLTVANTNNEYYGLGSMWDNTKESFGKIGEQFTNVGKIILKGFGKESEDGTVESKDIEIDLSNRKYDIATIHNSKDTDAARAIVNIIEGTFNVNWEDVVRGSSGEVYTDAQADAYIDFALRAIENGIGEGKNLVANKYHVFDEDKQDELTRRYLGIKDGVTDIKSLNTTLKGHKIWSVDDAVQMPTEEFINKIYEANELGNTDKSVPFKGRVVGQLDYNATVAGQAKDDSFIRGYVVEIDNKTYVINENPDKILQGEIMLNRISSARYTSGAPVKIPQLYGAEVAMLTDKDGASKYILKVNDETKAIFQKNMIEAFNSYNTKNPDNKLNSLDEYYELNPAAKSINDYNGITANSPEELLRMILNLQKPLEDGTLGTYAIDDFEDPSMTIKRILTNN